MNKTYTMTDLLEIMAKLRAPDGCPWDRKQTHQSLLNFLIEESYEFIDAVENNDRSNMREELGDVLLQVVLPNWPGKRGISILARWCTASATNWCAGIPMFSVS